MHNFKYLAAILIGSIIIMLILFLVTPILLPVPSEETCQKFDANDTHAGQFFCEHNSTGWHFNKTAYKESWENVSVT